MSTSKKLKIIEESERRNNARWTEYPDATSAVKAAEAAGMQNFKVLRMEDGNYRLIKEEQKMDNSEMVQQFRNAMRVLHDLCEGNCERPNCETCPYYKLCYTIADMPINWNVDREEEQ